MLAQCSHTFSALHCFNIHTNRDVFVLKKNYYQSDTPHDAVHRVFKNTVLSRKYSRLSAEHRVWPETSGFWESANRFSEKSSKIYFVLEAMRTSKAISLEFQYVPPIVETTRVSVGGTMTVVNRTCIMAFYFAPAW